MVFALASERRQIRPIDDMSTTIEKIRLVNEQQQHETRFQAPATTAPSQSNIIKFYQNRSVLITGGSGFVGKVLIEKLLRTCPDLRRIFVLIRPKWKKQPHERLQELLKEPLFDLVRKNKNNNNNAIPLEERVIVVEGDVTQPNLGLSEHNLLRIMNEVTVIYHSAATVKFDEPLKQAVAINIAGTKHIVELCRKIPQLAALVHVSTAYANCDKEEVEEYVYPSEMNPENLIEMAKWLDGDTLQELKTRLLGEKPNTYTYTKALGEWLLVECAKDLPVVICRPSIVVASWREPFSGWIDNVNGPTGIVLGTGKGLIRSMFAESSYVADLIPVDTVINLIVTLGWFANVYKKHRQINEAAESLTESLIGSVASDDLLDEYAERLVHPEAGVNSGQGNEAGNFNQGEDKYSGDNNNKSCFAGNNNNNNNSLNYNLDRQSYNNSNSSPAEVYKVSAETTNTSVVSNEGQHKSLVDEGYITITQTPGGNSSHSALSASKSSVSLSSSVSSLLIQPNETSTNETTAPLGVDNDNNNDNGNSDSGEKMGVSNQGDGEVLSFVTQRRLAEQKHADFEYKLKQFRHNTQVKLASQNLPEAIADVPVFHCTSGDVNPITWGRVQLLIVSILTIYPSISTYRYPNGSFTNNKRLDDFYRITLHYLPAYIIDFFTRITGGKPIVIRIFEKFDMAANVLKVFTSRQWKFKSDNRLMLINELMSEEDKRIFNCDIQSLDWINFLTRYVLGVRQFLLKEPLENLEQARTNLKIVYYRNLSLQVLFMSTIAYYFVTILFKCYS